jgi:hypothetical protein
LNPIAMTPDDPTDPERRTRNDRRRRNLPIWNPRRLRGRRERNRREDEDARPYFVDRVSAAVFAQAAMLLVLTLADALFTIALLDHGGFEEANPVMQALLDRGAWAFILGKYLIMVVFVPVALVMYRYRLFGTRLRVGHFVPVVTALYLALIVYQACLWRARNTATRFGEPSACGRASGGEGWSNVPRGLSGGRS